MRAGVGEEKPPRRSRRSRSPEGERRRFVTTAAAGLQDFMAASGRTQRSQRIRRVGWLLLLTVSSLIGAGIIWRFGWFRAGGVYTTVRLPYVIETRHRPPLVFVHLREATYQAGREGYSAGATVLKTWFIATNVELGPEGSMLVRHGAGLGATLITATGESTWCASDGEYVRFREDGRDALLGSEAGWLDVAEGCALIEGDAGWVGSERVEVRGESVYFRGEVVGTGTRLEQAAGGVAIRSAGEWVGTLGPGGLTPIDPAVAASLSPAWPLSRHGGVCINQTMGNEPMSMLLRMFSNVHGPTGRFTRCLRFRDGRVFDHPGLAIDVDLSVLRGHFIDLETGGDGGFPRWSNVPFEVPESWSGGCEVFVFPDGDVATGICW